MLISMYRSSSLIDAHGSPGKYWLMCIGQPAIQWGGPCSPWQPPGSGGMSLLEFSIPLRAAGWSWGCAPVLNLPIDIFSVRIHTTYGPRGQSCLKSNGLMLVLTCSPGETGDHRTKSARPAALSARITSFHPFVEATGPRRHLDAFSS